MATNPGNVSSRPIFTVENYHIWKFRVRSYLKAQHCKMWEIITDGPIIIWTIEKKVSLDITKDPYDETTVKSKSEFTTEERKLDELDDHAKNIISSTVPDKHIAKLMRCDTAKEMWETLKRVCVGSEEILENKLSIACQKFDSFKMLKNESVDEMEYKFNQLLNKIQSMSKDKYNQRDINLKVIRALPAAN
ncbi:uncharacterized protein LOC130990684 [Salvia miltiorrhiza]|uniref:uncharacterized protein LOC130990684 n=1 Tax=Salvia miltiorrhiza TaxID=226208 RepID=UPI0025AB8C83|nr:uncharacterized protein LOC130990684 [Salvia miltiorrhiza]